MMQKKTLIYIASDVRAGSTLLDYLLSNNNQMISVGELVHLNDYLNRRGVGYSLDWCCSCGKQFKACPFWSKVVAQYEKNEGQKLVDIETRYSIYRRAWKEFLISFSIFLIPFKILKKKLLKHFYCKDESVTIINNCCKVLDYVCSVSDRNIVIDSSKMPDRVLALLSTGQTDYTVKVIHLVRDARAVSFSKLKRGQQLNMKINFLSAIVGWVIVNLKLLNIKLFFEEADFVRIKYEDLCENPTNTIYKICGQLDLPYESEMTVLKKMDKHNVGGSQHRFENTNEIKLDQRWKSNMDLSKQLAYFSTAFLLNKFFGY